MKVKIYTDGACSVNTGKGGWGMVVCLPNKTVQKSGYEEPTTNNRMELTGATKAIQYVLDMIYQGSAKVDELEIISDSAYVVNAINLNWMYFWKNNGYINSKGEQVKNKDLWDLLDSLLQEAKFIDLNVVFTKVKGHAGNSMNELADKLATGEVKKHS
jgi:ribonuclease HI